MRSPIPRKVIQAALVLIIAGGLVLAGRLTVDPGHGGAQAYAAGYGDGHYAGYFTGLRDGIAQGRQEGRVLQEVGALRSSVRRPVQEAFDDGYAAGANDVFAGYDGGWILKEPYVVTLAQGKAPIVYRVSSRTPVEADMDYFRCDTGTGLCQEPRR